MSYVFKKCFCCSKNVNITKLVDLNENSVVIGEETIDFAEILLDVCFVYIDPSTPHHICDDCRNQLIQFHMFKRDCKKYSSFKSNISRLKIILEVDECLMTFDDQLPVQVHKTEDEIVLKIESLKQQIEEGKILEETVIDQSQHCESFHDNLIEEDTVESDVSDSELIKEEYIYESDQDISDIQENISETFQTDDNIRFEVKPKRVRTKKYKYSANTNESLSEQQKDWICRQVRRCEKVLENGQVIYECSMCPTSLKIPGSLRKHLRDCHLLKSQEDQKIKDCQRAFRDEIATSKLIIDSVNGLQAIWRCQRCQMQRIFHSEAAFKFHVRFEHIRSGQIDSKFIAQCKIKGDDGKDSWACPVDMCSKVVRSRDGLRNHLKLEHPDAFGDETTEIASSAPQSLFYTETSEESPVLSTSIIKRRQPRLERLVCNDCGVKFVSGTSKKEKTHRLHHECHKILNVVSQFYQLPRCEESKVMFCNDEDLSRFLSSDEPYFQPIPAEGMTSKVTQKIHDPVGSSHDDSSWKCGHCATKFLTEIECTAHIMILHSKTLICPQDHLEFEGNRGISLFNQHMQNKHPTFFPDFQVACRYCGENFSTIYERLSHMKTCAEKKIQCDHCGKFFFKKSEVARHLKIEFGILRYECEVCQKLCASTMDLKLHRATHTNLKSYACSFPDCGKFFKTPAARSSHMEQHSEDRNYSCSQCPSTFKRRTLLQRHLKKCSQRGFEKIEIICEEIYS